MPLTRTLDSLIYALVRVFFAFVGVLPRFLAYRVCEGLAALVFLLDKKHRRIGMINLSIAFPERDEHWKKLKGTHGIVGWGLFPMEKPAALWRAAIWWL